MLHRSNFWNPNLSPSSSQSNSNPSSPLQKSSNTYSNNALTSYKSHSLSNKDLKKEVALAVEKKFKLNRIACDYNTRTLFIECYQVSSKKKAEDEYDFEDDFEMDDDYDFSLSNKSSSKTNSKKNDKNDKSQTMDAFVKRIHIKSSKNKSSKEVTEYLIEKFPNYLNSSQISFAQLHEIIDKLVNQDVKATEQKKQITQSATESSAPNPFAKYKENNNTNSSSNSSSNKQTIPPKLVTISKDDDILDIDLNKCSDDLNFKAKKIMDKDFEAKRLKPGDNAYVYDKRIDFGPPEEDNDWDESADE